LQARCEGASDHCFPPMAMSTSLFQTPTHCSHGSGLETDAGTIEAKLVSQLILFLGMCPRSLKEISSIAPHHACRHVHEVGGVLNWLRNYNELFSISGKPGEEVVSLKVSRKSNPTSESLSAQWKDGRPHDFARACTSCDETPESAIESALLLRGLPYQATENDIRHFLGSFTKKLKGDAPIQMILNKGKRPSGFAKIQLDNPNSARDACKCLHKHLMADRYVEVFPFGEKKYKAITRLTAVAYQSAAADTVNSQEDQQTRSAVVQECRDYMASSGRNQLLLSALGSALSNDSRSYLKRTCQGLKQLLREHPEEFEFRGMSQQQTVMRVSVLKPSDIQSSDYKSGDAATYPSNSCTRLDKDTSGIIKPHRNLKLSSMEARRALCGTPCASHVDDIPPPQTPEPQPHSMPHALQTPSDWGTPCPGDCETWRTTQQTLNGVQWPAHPEFHGISSVFQGNLSHNLQNVAQGLQSQGARSSNSHNMQEQGCPASNTPTAVCIHGLPCYTAEQDVLAFFSAHNVAQFIEDIPNPVLFRENTVDVSVKSAVVSLQSSAAIQIVLQALQGRQWDLHTISVTALSGTSKYPKRVSGMAGTNLAPSLATQSKSDSWSVDHGRAYMALFDFLVLARCKDNLYPCTN